MSFESVSVGTQEIQNNKNFYYNLVGLHKTKQHAYFYNLKPPSGKVKFFVILVFTGTTKERQVKQFG